MLDLKLVNGRIIDGTGAPWFRGDVGIRQDRIVAIGDLRDTPAASTIDAHDRVIAPGFIDLLGWSQTTAIHDPQLEAKVRQGVTTEVAGEGFSPGPVRPENVRKGQTWATLGDFLDELDQHGAAINFALLVGASNPREIVIGDINRIPTAGEMRQMEAIVEQAMRDGAIGVSTSLIYVPAMYSTTEEIINLSRVAAKHGGVYFTHMRDEGNNIDSALDETFRIGREANIPVNIWHLKIGGRPNWGKMPHIIGRIAEQRTQGLDIAANVYPYIASGTGLSTLAPDWALEGGYDDFRTRLANPDDRTKIREALRAQVARRGDRGIYITQIFSAAHKQYEKMYIEQVAAAMNLSGEDALLALFENSDPSPRVIFFSMNEDDVRYALQQPWVSVGSDGSSPTARDRENNTAVHPRSYGTFPRVIGYYAREQKLFSIEEAVRKMTSQAAARVHFADRGILRPGMKADVIVFDPETTRDLATFEDPHHFSAGVSDVVVNGVPVLRDGTMTGALPGKSIRGRGYERDANPVR
ncbi:MAG TPA: D-aminoacylase [Thermoanaerobaculia bacterium]|nr:D-aminoacylase [Thermoanaerobaculia bacterium]